MTSSSLFRSSLAGNQSRQPARQATLVLLLNVTCEGTKPKRTTSDAHFSYLSLMQLIKKPPFSEPVVRIQKLDEESNIKSKDGFRRIGSPRIDLVVAVGAPRGDHKR